MSTRTSSLCSFAPGLALHPAHRARRENVFCLRVGVVSLFKYKERIVELSRLSEEEVVRQFYLLLRHVTVSKEEFIKRAARKESVRLCRGVDMGDALHVGLTLSLDGLLWTGDKALKRGLRSGL